MKLSKEKNKSVEMLLLQHKDKIYWSIMSTALNLDIQKGHLRWTYTQLSKLSGVSRTLIYYYFGKSKENILYEAIYFIGSYLLGTNSEQNKKWEKGDLYLFLKTARIVVVKIPSIVPFFFIHRGKKTQIGKELVRVRNIFITKIKMKSPHLTTDEIKAIHAMMVGLLFTQALTDKVLREGCKKITSLMQK